jgi:TnpA family transposase
MPRRSILTATERENLFGWPEAQAELIRHYTLSATDVANIRQHRGAANRLGYAIQLCYMRHPGVALGSREKPFIPLLEIVAAQLRIPVERWSEYGQRAETRREHALELQALFGFKAFTMRHYREGVRSLEDVAWQADKGIVLASVLVDEYRRQQVLFPTLSNIERICAER